MSFLPYAPTRSSSWALAFGGSTAMHGAVVVALLSSSVALLPEPSTPAVREPEYEITLEILDADIIEIEEEPLIPPDAIPLNPDEAVADELEQADDLLAPEDAADLLAPEDSALQPEDAALEPEAEEILAPEPELLAPEPDVLAPVEDTFAALDPEPETPPLAPEPEAVAEPEVAPLPFVDPDEVVIEDLSPIDDTVFSPLAEAVAPAPEPDPTLLAPDAISPDVVIPDTVIVEEDIAAVVLPEPTLPAPEILAPETEVALPTPEVVDPEPEVIAPEPEAVAPEPEVVAPDPEPEPETPPEVEEQSPEIAPEVAAEEAPGSDGTIDGAPIIDTPSPAVRQIGALLQRIRATPAPQCTLALPRRAGADGVGVSFIGADVATLDALAARVVDGLDIAPTQTREVLDPRQCAMLDAVRLSGAYPASRIGLAVAETTLRSGDSLQARVVGAGGLFLTLLLIDDNGVVQDLARFTSLDGNEPVIDVPVARAGPARDTRQVLLVLGSPDGPIDLGNGIGREAQDAFSGLNADVLEGAVFGLVTFDVR